MPAIDRRKFINGAGASAAAPLIHPVLQRGRSGGARAQGGGYDVYVARNGTPVSNVQMAIALAGGIQRFVNADDVVVLKPNGQWPLQGYTHTQSMKSLIDVVLARPGGFTGEVVIAEHVHRNYPEAETYSNYCWNMSSGYNRTNNWPDMNYFQLVADYHSRGLSNVSAVPLYDNGQGPRVAVASPGDLTGNQQGWVRSPYTLASHNNRTVNLSRPVLRSPYSGKVVDLRYGVLVQ